MLIVHRGGVPCILLIVKLAPQIDAESNPAVPKLFSGRPKSEFGRYPATQDANIVADCMGNFRK